MDEERKRQGVLPERVDEVLHHVAPLAFQISGGGGGRQPGLLHADVARSGELAQLERIIGNHVRRLDYLSLGYSCRQGGSSD
jgi:hypothetical protein